jgi:hypothetical protein
MKRDILRARRFFMYVKVYAVQSFKIVALAQSE